MNGNQRLSVADRRFFVGLSSQTKMLCIIITDLGRRNR